MKKINFSKGISLLLALMLVISSAFVLTSCEKSARVRGGDAEESAPEVISAQEAVNALTDSTTAVDFIKNINCGWNLGNTLEATGIWDKDLPATYTVKDIETGWGNPVTTKEMFDAVKTAGFNAVRIPISWCRFIEKSGDKYTVRDDFMKRVKEVVSYAYDNDMFAIINVHHDDDTNEWMSIAGTDAEFEKVKNEYSQLWSIIADNFKDYDLKLIFEGANEIVYRDGENADWWGQNQESFDRLNALYQIFVDNVRKSGGNNAKRFLMLPTYGAQWYTQQFDKLVIPNKDNRCIADIHWYTASTNASKIESTLKEITNSAALSGTAVILGECGIKNETDEATKIAWAQAFVKTASNLGLRCFIWDDGGDFSVLNRKTLKWYSADFVKAFVNNAAISDESSNQTSAQ